MGIRFQSWNEQVMEALAVKVSTEAARVGVDGGCKSGGQLGIG